MLNIKRGTLNNLSVTASQYKSLVNPYYLFSFQHILSKEVVRFFPKNISTSSNRYDEFSFYEGDEPVGYTGDVPYVVFPFPGQYYYSIYESYTSGSTNPIYAYNKLEEGRAYIEDDIIPPDFNFYTAGNENNENFIYYDENVNRTPIITSFRSVGFNSLQTQHNWNDIYPDLLVKDSYTGFQLRVKNTLYDKNECGYYTQYSADTSLFPVFTGTGKSSLTFELDPDQVIGYGYTYTGGSTNYRVKEVIENLRSGLISGFIYGDRMWYYADGSTEFDADVVVLRYNDLSIVFPKFFGLFGGNPPCDDFLLTESGDELLTEDNNYIVI